jgi:hypothetical protein
MIIRPIHGSFLIMVPLYSPFSACCVCGGGNADFENIDDGSSCHNLFGFIDLFNDGCAWYALNSCEDAANYYNNIDVSALEACCVCGGGGLFP